MKEKTRYLIGAGVLAMAAILICIGVRNGEMATVLKKAVNICLECIGIG